MNRILFQINCNDGVFRNYEELGVKTIYPIPFYPMSLYQSCHFTQPAILPNAFYSMPTLIYLVFQFNTLVAIKHISNNIIITRSTFNDKREEQKAKLFYRVSIQSMRCINLLTSKSKQF